MLRGIDVSHYQGQVDWHSVARSDVKFALAKASESTKPDDQFARNWSQMQEVGLYRGAYHFGHPGSDPEAQASFFASVAGPLGFRDLPPVLDLEVADGHDAPTVLAWARAFLQKAEQLFGRKMMIYTGAFWRANLGNPPPDPFFSERLLWLSGYVQASSLVIPRTWTKWTFWQYSEGTHNNPVSIPGVAPCDQNLFDGDDTALGQLCSTAASPVPPQPAPVTGGAWPGVEFVWPRTPPVQSDAAKAWQTQVRNLGDQLDADGVYGPQSKTACLVFQRNNGLGADGIVGRATWDAAFAATAV